ncbi:glycoside hydrolase/deacetylase [Clathrospora elynae]|uniref:Glycoside hydrolase/deacetylase n=1 Tax=Clathrospora elynae TaxID=706981 RepID=A0A6A5SII5_9PLEO|nr:glycoside hydrolase/deacetylase [Clathrospora elynae]
MRFSNIVTVSVGVVVPLVAAHGAIPGVPKIFGLPRDLKERAPINSRVLRHSVESKGGLLETRQGGQNGRCGPGFGGASCASGYCCSGAGYCGTTNDHCSAPDCLIDFGPACDANKTPAGASTRNDARPRKGNVAYGGDGIYACQNAGTVAITYDDGPYIYTDSVLDQFASFGFKATFFITGINNGKGAIDTTASWSNVIKRMVAEGHQVGSHTWSHQDLSVISDTQRYDQMVKNEIAIRNILGKYPTYMRPPYSSCNAACQAVMGQLGYVISYFDLDTDDYNQLSNIQVAKDNFKRILDATAGGPATGDRLAIAHDIHEATALSLTGYMLQYLKDQGYRGVTMGECMGDPEANWYRTSGEGGSTSPPPPSGGLPVSTDGSCSAVKGTCAGSSFGNCCSQYGWCGSSQDHCGASCNALFGNCGSGTAPAPTPAPAPAPTPTPTPTPAPAPAPNPAPGKPVSTDGLCGTQTCAGSPFGNCCSQYGWCGSSADHCGSGCNAAAGQCT